MELNEDPAVVTAEELKLALIAAIGGESPFAVQITSVERGYLPKTDLKTTLPAGGVYVTVMPGLDGDDEPLNNAAQLDSFQIAVVIESKLDTDQFNNETLDALAGLMQAIRSFIESVGELPSGAVYQRKSKASPRYSYRQLKLTRTFVALRRFEFKIGLKAGL